MKRCLFVWLVGAQFTGGLVMERDFPYPQKHTVGIYALVATYTALAWPTALGNELASHLTFTP